MTVYCCTYVCMGDLLVACRSARQTFDNYMVPLADADCCLLYKRSELKLALDPVQLRFSDTNETVCQIVVNFFQETTKHIKKQINKDSILLPPPVQHSLRRLNTAHNSLEHGF